MREPFELELPPRMTRPSWFIFVRRSAAAWRGDHAHAPEDAAHWLKAFDAAGATTGDDAVSLEDALGLPRNWRFMKRQFEREEILEIFRHRGYRGRPGASRLWSEIQRCERKCRRALQAGRNPAAEAVADEELIRLVELGGADLSEGTLAKWLK